MRVLSFLLLFFSFVPLQTVAAQSCKDCQKKYRISCERRCDSQPSAQSFDACRDTCVSKACASSCSSAELAESARAVDPKEKCTSCLEKAEQITCRSECDPESPRFRSCVKKCAKNTCVDACDLPFSTRQNDEPGKYDCQICRDKNRRLCALSPDCPPGPGSIACRVACAEERCQKECR
jgi:hypothetical protein